MVSHIAKCQLASLSFEELLAEDGRRLRTAAIGEVVKAYVVLKEEHGRGMREADLLTFCKESLTPYKVPRLVEFRDELPVNTAGTILRRLLRSPKKSA